MWSVKATEFCASLFHNLPWSLEDISPDAVSEGQHLLWLIVLWPSVLTRGYQSRWGQWRPTCATVHCTMTFHTRLEVMRAQTWSVKVNSAVANCSMTFCGHWRILWPSHGQWRPTSAAVHCTMTFHTRVEMLGPFFLSYELLSQRKLVYEESWQSLYPFMPYCSAWQCLAHS